MRKIVPLTLVFITIFFFGFVPNALAFVLEDTHGILLPQTRDRIEEIQVVAENKGLNLGLTILKDEDFPKNVFSSTNTDVETLGEKLLSRHGDRDSWFWTIVIANRMTPKGETPFVRYFVSDKAAGIFTPEMVEKAFWHIENARKAGGWQLGLIDFLSEISEDYQSVSIETVILFLVILFVVILLFLLSSLPSSSGGDFFDFGGSDGGSSGFSGGD